MVDFKMVNWSGPTEANPSQTMTLPPLCSIVGFGFFFSNAGSDLCQNVIKAKQPSF